MTGVTVTAIHQFLPTLDRGDAVGNMALEVRDVVLGHGIKSAIFAERWSSRARKDCAPYRKYERLRSSDDHLIYHYSIGSVLTEYVTRWACPKLLIYHNVTPAEYMRPYNPQLCSLLLQAREQIESLSHLPALCFSEYSAQELRSLSFSRVMVIPFLWNTRQLEGDPDKSLLRRYRDGTLNILFVGRVAPNKRHDDLIKIFAFYQRHVNPRSRLLLVGSYEGMEQYYFALQNLVQELEVADVTFTGKVGNPELIAYYQLADIFVCMSEHEGFGAPLIEAMCFDTPVVAFNSSAIPYTLGGAGVLVREKDYAEVAELIELIRTDGALRSRILATQRARLRELVSPASRETFWKVLKEMLA